MNVQKLMRGSPSETLELLQWIYKLLKKQKIIVNYDPFDRRLRSYKGGTDKIPLPFWTNSHFDVFGRPDSANHRRTGKNVDTQSSEDRRSRLSKTPIPLIGSGSSQSSRYTPFHRTASVDGRRSAAELTYGTKRKSASKRRTLRSSMGPRTPKDRLGRRQTYSSLTPSARSVPGGPRSEASSSLPYVVDLKSIERSLLELPTAPTTPKTAEVISATTEEAILAIKKCLETLKISIPNFQTLIGDLGTEWDSYAYRGKLRGLKDIISILIRHNNLLVDELRKLQRIPEEEEFEDEDKEETKDSFPQCVKQISNLEQEFETCIQHLTELETRNPVPRNCSLRVTERQNKLSDTVAIDSSLRSIGAAQANLNQPSLSFGVVHCRSSEGSSPRIERIHSAPETQTTKPTNPASFLDGEYQVRRMRNGDFYKGKYSDNKKHGEGVYLFSSGDTYEGNFVEDCMSGFGVYSFAVEGRYEGEWRNSVYEGVGIETFARGSTYQGEYNNGQRHGWGACRYVGGAYYEGEWCHGLRNGRGMQQCVDGSNHIGEYLAGKRQGLGIYCFPNGDHYIGEFDQDVPHGVGVYIFTSGPRYEGQWKTGIKHGWCVYSIETGETWAGEWSEGRPLWAQALSPKDQDTIDPHWSEDICKRVEASKEASEKAKEAEKKASEKAEFHWRADGEVQKSINEVRSRSEEAVKRAQEERKIASIVAQKLDILATDHQARFDS